MRTHKMYPLVCTLVALVFACHAASAQVKVSLSACPQINENISVRIGTDVDIPLNARWSFVPGAYWSLRIRNSDVSKEYTNDRTTSRSHYDYHDKAHFLTIPVRMGLRLNNPTNENLALKLLFGPYIAYGMGGTSKCDITKDGTKEQTETGSFDKDGRYRTRWDYGINVGLNLVVKKHFQFGIFSETGFRKIYNSNNAVEDLLGEIFIVNKINLAFGLSLGYQF